MKELKKAIDNFDFEKVHKVMTLLNWTYLNTNVVPTVKQLKQTVSELYIQAEKDSKFCASGGFEVKIFDNNMVKISFIVEKSYSIGLDSVYII